MTTDKPIQFYGALWCGDCRRSKSFLDSHDIAYDFHNTDNDPDALLIVTNLNNGNRVIPTIVFNDGSHVTEPSNAELAQKLNIVME